MLESEALKIVDDALEADRTPAIMLHLPYPPTEMPRLRSRLGGLPQLPGGFEWPSGCGEEGEVPLHFLAQIDCSELPRVDPRMPGRGMLFFFGRDDEEQVWQDFDPQESARVIYAPEVPAGQPLRSAPAELPPIRDEYAHNDREWLLPGERGPSVHASWPVVPLLIDSWPDYPRFSSPESLPARSNVELNELRKIYARRVNALRVAAVAAATGLSTDIDWKQDAETHFSAGAHAFPRVGVMIDRFARLATLQASQFRTHGSYKDPENQERFGRIEATGLDWINRAKEIGLDAPLPDEDAAEFANWLHQLTDRNFSGVMAGYYISRIFSKALQSSITYAAGSPSATALIPRHFYDLCNNNYLPFIGRQRAGELGLEARVHQISGHASSCQDLVGSDDDVLLLQIRTDYRLPMKFGDAGEASFWIKADDLNSRRFDKAWGDIAGH